MNETTQYIKRPTDRAAWLDTIRPFIGGSEVAALIKRTPDFPKFVPTPMELWQKKTGRAEEEEPRNWLALEMGNRTETDAAEFYTRETGRQVRNYGYIVTRGHARADVDRLVVPDGEKVASHREEVRAAGIVECKDPGAFWTEDEGEIIPVWYQAQAQLYMELLDLPWTDFAVLFHAPRWDFKVYRLERVREYGEALVDAIERFWTNYVVPDTPPPVNGLADCRLRWPTSRAVEVEADPETAGKVVAMRALKAAHIGRAEQIKRLEGEVGAVMGEADTLTINGVPVVTFKTPKPTDRIDFKGAFEDLALALHAEPMQTDGIISKHRTLVNGARRFLLKAEKGAKE